MRLSAGLVTDNANAKCRRSDAYQSLERFSDAFLARHGDWLGEYAAIWCADPFHAWSRGYEYTFVLGELGGLPEGARVLDVGSGVTFFPHYLTEVMGMRVTCLDADRQWYRLNERIAAERGNGVTSIMSDAEALPYAPGVFDAAYCVSVLEHLPNPLSALAQLTRVVKPGGMVAWTWDVPAPGGYLSNCGLSVACASLVVHHADDG